MDRSLLDTVLDHGQELVVPMHRVAKAWGIIHTHVASKRLLAM